MPLRLFLPVLHPGRVVTSLILYSGIVIARYLFDPQIFYAANAVSVMVAFLGGYVLLVLPSVRLVLASVLVFLAGKSELGPIWTGVTDVTFLLLVGFLLFVVNRMWPGKNVSRIFKINCHPMVFALFGFSVLYALQFALSPVSDYAVTKTVRVAGYCLAIAVIFAHVMATPKARELFARYYLIVVGAMSVTAFAIAVAQQGLMGIRRIAPIGGGPITIGRFAGFAAILCLALFLSNGKKGNLIGFTWFLSFTLLNGSRGPLLALLITLGLFSIVMFMVKSVRKRGLGLAAYLLASVLGMTVMFLSAAAAGVPFAQRYMLLFTSDGRGDSVDVRSAMLSDSRELYHLAPFWGSGVASWPLISDWPNYPHNLFAELAVENGAIGLLFFSSVVSVGIILGSSYLLSARSSPMYADAMIGVCLLVFSLIGAQVSGDIFDNRYIWVSLGWITAVAGSRTGATALRSTGQVAFGSNVQPNRAK